MKIYVITDTHFGHDALVTKFKSRPAGFSQKIIRNCQTLITDEDLLIHLGDVVVGNAENWTAMFAKLLGRKVLVTGNHDKRTYQWYMKNGLDFVCSKFEWKLFGKRILFTHEPELTGDFDLNIHGHLHVLGHHQEYITDHRHYLLSLEDCGYQPLRLETIFKKWKRSPPIANM